MIATTTAVPRSGSSTIRPATSTRSGRAGTSWCERVSGWPSPVRLRCCTSASQSRTASLAISAGCTTNGPSPIHRVEPPRVRPTPGTSTSTSPTIAAMTSGHDRTRQWRWSMAATSRNAGTPTTVQAAWRRRMPNASPDSAASTTEAEKLITSPTTSSRPTTTVSATASWFQGPLWWRSSHRRRRPSVCAPLASVAMLMVTRPPPARSIRRRRSPAPPSRRARR